MKKIRLSIVRFAPLLLILAFAATQYILIFRHKSPYLSDSYFYKHIFYQIKGDSYDLARQKVVSQVDLTNADEITINFFTKGEAYKNSLSFFTKRPLYPIFAVFVNLFTSNEFLDFVTPIFAAYLISIILTFYIFRLRLSYFFAIFATALFISFYPFLDWSTYFLTDTIGFAFWILQILFIYKFLKGGKLKFKYLFLGTLVFSLLNREQSLFILPMILLLYVLAFIFKLNKKIKLGILKLVITTSTIAIAYLLISLATAQKSISDTIIYTQNSYGLYNHSYKISETLKYLINAIIHSHIVFIGDLTRNHWWFVFFGLGFYGMLKLIFSRSVKKLIDLVIFSSIIASYISIFVYPVLSYRYFFPVVVGILYFSVNLIENFFGYQKNKLKYSTE